KSFIKVLLLLHIISISLSTSLIAEEVPTTDEFPVADELSIAEEFPVTEQFSEEFPITRGVKHKNTVPSRPATQPANSIPSQPINIQSQPAIKITDPRACPPCPTTGGDCTVEFNNLLIPGLITAGSLCVTGDSQLTGNVTTCGILHVAN